MWCRWNNCGKNLLFFGLPSDWIPCGHMEHFRVEKNGADKISALFFWKNVPGIIALRINYASIAENTTEKITLCWIKSALDYGKTSEHGKIKALKCVLRHGKTIALSRTSAEKTMPLNSLTVSYTNKSTQSVAFCY